MSSPYPYVRAIVYSSPMCGKSTFAATWPKPMVVACFDPYQKESPYLDKGYYDEPLLMEDGTPYRDVCTAEGELLVRVVYFHDEVPERPDAYKRFMRFMNGFTAEERRKWETFVLDSTSAMMRANLFMHTFDLNPGYKDPRKWHADVADYLERLVIGRFSAIRDINILLLSHISTKMDEASGGYVNRIKLPGRLGMDGPDSFPEIYRLYVEQGTGRRLLQTQKQADQWLVGSQFCRASSPCLPKYSALWVNWTDRSRPPVQVVEDGARGDAPMEVIDTVATVGEV